MSAPVRIPFDSLTLAAAVSEARDLVGGRVQKIAQPDALSAVLEVFAGSRRFLLLSCDPVFFRAHLVRGLPKRAEGPTGFGQALRARLTGSRLLAVRQKGFDRILTLEFDGERGPHKLVAELMGKHSNLILVDSEGAVVAAAKRVGPDKSSRPVLPGRVYTAPPLAQRPSVGEVRSDEELQRAEGASPFLLALLRARAGHAGWAGVRKEIARIELAVSEGRFEPVRVPGAGAYPVSVAALGYEESPVRSLSEALEDHYGEIAAAAALEQSRRSLLGQLDRVILSREVALQSLKEAAQAAERAREMQEMGELILAFGDGKLPGARAILATRYDGAEVSIPTDPELGKAENAQVYFLRAKKAKARKDEVCDQLARIAGELAEARSTAERARKAASLQALQEVASLARARRWLTGTLSNAAFEKSVATQRAGRLRGKPSTGSVPKVREVLGPGGLLVLYGENAASNDYLTLRLAKPDDWWLHVRGAVSAHVIIRSDGRPERVGREALLFAARIAVRNSAAKHSKFVPVDYTLRKHVRKPRGAPPGTAVYTHERTLHVENE